MMRFDDLNKRLRQYETAYDFCVPQENFIVVRLDGRGFTRLTKEIWQFEAPFDIRFRDLMAHTVRHLMKCGFNVAYGYSESDEISLLLRRDDDTFKRKTRKIISVLAGEASAAFSVAHGQTAAFDARVCVLPNEKAARRLIPQRAQRPLLLDAAQERRKRVPRYRCRQRPDTRAKARFVI